MLVLHAFWAPGRGPGIWAEDSDAAVSSPSEALRQARPHPFAAPVQALLELVDGTPSTATLLLPSLRRSPLDSPEMVRIAARPPSRTAASLLPWAVPTILLEPARIAETLSVFTDDPDLDEDASRSFADLRPAPSVRYLVAVSRWAEDVIARGRILPCLVREDDCEARAGWRPVLTGGDAVVWQSLVGAMPPAFRATEVAGRSDRLAGEALTTIVDALVRRRLPESFLPKRRGRRPARTPIAEAWLDALTGADGHLRAEPDEIDDLAEHLRPWDQVGIEDAGPASLVLRLADPPSPDIDTAAESGDPHWRLEFLLRSRADPSLLVDAERVWADDGTLHRWLERPREVLLAELARAQRVYPGLEPGLRQARPSGIDLDVSATHAFLAGSAAALDDAGFEVQLPSWWGRRASLGLHLSATPSDSDATASHFSRDQLCDFHWDLAVGEHGLTDEEITALTAAKDPLVRLRGQWVSIDHKLLEQTLDFLRGGARRQMSAGEVLRLALSHPDDLDLPLDLVGVAAGGWLGEFLGGAASDSVAPVTPPDDFTATLRPYQSRGLAWLDFLGRLGLGACLADDMGLGKTVQLLALEATARTRTATAAQQAAPDAGGSTASRPTLLVCPMSLIDNWRAEAARFAPGLRVTAHHGAARPHGDNLLTTVAASDLVITTYTTALNDIDELAGIEFERVVLDEAQAVKNRHSRTAKAVRRLSSGQRIALTGTPVENRLAELWSIMDFVNPGILGTPEQFRTRFATPIERRQDDRSAVLLRRITQPYILRRLKSDPSIIDDLPEKIEIKQHYRLTIEQASLYQSVVDDMLQRIEDSEGIARRGNVLAAMTKLKQICNHPAQLLHDRSGVGRRSGKVIRLEEVLEEVLAEGDRVLCFTQYTEFAEMLVPHLASRFDTNVAYLSGSTSRERRTELVRRFQAGEGAPIFVLSLKAGGTGLNLTAANHVIHLDRWWNPAVEDQATDRAFRIGQHRSVQVRKFVGIGTLEERIDAMIDEKRALANLVVGDGEAWLTELSTGQLRELFTLSKDAVDA